jgi:hypothetical protein
MEQEYSDFDLAIVDVLKAFIELLAAKGVASHEEFGQLLAVQLQGVQQRNPKGVLVFQVLVDFCERHASAHALHRATPSGSA